MQTLWRICYDEIDIWQFDFLAGKRVPRDESDLQERLCSGCLSCRMRVAVSQTVRHN